MNAFEIYESAFNKANHNNSYSIVYGENSIEYIMDYAANELDNTISKEIANDILERRWQWLALEEKNGNYDDIVKNPLEKISAS